MDAITSYIDHMFRGLAPSAEVRRAKSELLQMSEDRYRELLAEGVSEHEAVGRVITQFGNLNELADELGIRAEVDGLDVDQVHFSDQEADHYLSVRRRASFLIAAGVGLILVGFATLVGLSDGSVVSLYGAPSINVEMGEPIALSVLFICVAVAVGMFIFAGVSMSRFPDTDGRLINLSHAATERYRAQRADETTRYALFLSLGVGLIILSVAQAVILSVIGGNDSALERLGSILLFPGVAIGVAILIINGMRRAALDRLTSSGEYTIENLRSNSLLDRIAGPYWMLAILVYLAWSFIGDAWSRSWIVWPIAGVLFGLLAATLEGIGKGKKRV